MWLAKTVENMPALVDLQQTSRPLPDKIGKKNTLFFGVFNALASFSFLWTVC